MIEGFNPSSINLSEEEFSAFAEHLSDAADYKEVLENLKKRRENALNGGVNCIPFPFVRFRGEVPGVEQGQYVLVTANQKVGKCFGKGTKIRMGDNTIKNIEDIRVGDWVMSPNEEAPKQVLSLGSGREKLFRIKSEMHDDLIVNESHIMYLYKCPGPRRKERYFTLTIKELLELQKNVKNFKKYYQMVASDECDYGISVNLSIEPYFYGLWLGDGATSGTSITTMDEEIVDYLKDYANRLNMKLTETNVQSRCSAYTISRTSHKDIGGFKQKLIKVTGAQKKHINRDYLNASINDRYQLLAGLIDSDGYLNKHKTGYQITLKDYTCIKDIQELVRSLGLSTTIKVKHNSKYNKDYYTLRISGRNCVKIPVRLERKKCILTKKNPRHFSFSIEEIGEGDYYGITVGGNHLFLLEDYTIVHNSSLASFLYIYNVLDYCYEHPDKCSCHIIYFALEESKQRVIERYMSHLLYKLNKIRISPQDLRSTSIDYPAPEAILNLFEEEEYQKRLDFFNQCVQFETENTNPTGMLRVCEEYAKSVGKFNSHTEKSNGLSGNDVKVFDSYTQDDPNHYKIMFIDHVSLVDKEQGFSNKQAVDKISEYCVKYLRNRYNYTCVVIQQQASETEGLEAIKMKKMMPSTSGLSDSKYTGRDSNLVLGLFDPSKFGLPSWLGYKIQEPGTNKGLKNYGRFLYVLANRDGEMGGICPLFFDGAVTNFEELPKPDGVEIDKYYNLADKLRSFRQQSKLEQLKSAVLLFFIRKFKNKN